MLPADDDDSAYGKGASVTTTTTTSTGRPGQVMAQMALDRAAANQKSIGEIKTLVAALSSSSTATKLKLDNATSSLTGEIVATQRQEETMITEMRTKFATQAGYFIEMIAGTLTLLSCMISLQQVASHLHHYHRPDVQRKVIDILWMVPIFAISGFVTLVSAATGSWCALIRDCYEGFVVYTFLALLYAILGDNDLGKVVGECRCRVAAASLPCRGRTLTPPAPHQRRSGIRARRCPRRSTSAASAGPPGSRQGLLTKPWRARCRCVVRCCFYYYYAPTAATLLLSLLLLLPPQASTHVALLPTSHSAN